MGKNKNLPAINSINLFTSSKNVQHAKIQEVEDFLKKAKNIKITGAASFDVDISKVIFNLNRDTLIYIKDTYSFSAPITSNYGAYLAFHIRKIIYSKTGVKVVITCISEDFNINLLSNDVNQEI